MTQTPGITESTNGGPGTTTSVRIRGAEAGDTLVLIDGVQMNDPSGADDSYDFGNLLVGDISRIEILRGSASTLYGSQAIGGVVNIITAQPHKDGLSGDVQGESGSLSTSLVKGGIGGKFDQFTFRARRRAITTPTAFRPSIRILAARKPTPPTTRPLWAAPNMISRRIFRWICAAFYSHAQIQL